MNLPPGLPPLPPVPDGYDVNAWAYRGTNWNPGEFRNYAYYKPGLSDGWVPSFGMKPIGSSGHYIEAVREPAEPSAQLFATLDPENDASACPECVQGYVQETGFNRCAKCNPAASGVDARVCEGMSDRSTPLTDESSFSTVHQGELVKASFARDLERKLAEAREALESADRLIAACGYMPSDATRSKIAQALAFIDAKGKETA